MDGDTIAILPTSYGKSLIYYTLPYTGDHKSAIVSCPLDAIVIEQVGKLGDKALHVSPKFVQALDKGKYRFKVAYPA